MFLKKHLKFMVFLQIFSREIKFKEIVDELINFINGNDLIIHNASFDIPFINHELKLLKKDLISKNKIIDTLELARSNIRNVKFIRRFVKDST